LRSQGHVHVGKYAIWQVQRETQMAREQVNQMLASEMSLMRLMLLATLNGKDSARQFDKTIDRLQG
jgi:hypothetical protein